MSRKPARLPAEQDRPADPELDAQWTALLRRLGL
jgi:hypothetical protein